MNAKNRAVKWAVAACIGIAGAAGAANTITMSAVEGVWNVATNWGGNVAPTTGDYAVVEGTAYRRVYITNGVAAAAGRLSLAVTTGAGAHGALRHERRQPDAGRTSADGLRHLQQ